MPRYAHVSVPVYDVENLSLETPVDTPVDSMSSQYIPNMNNIQPTNWLTFRQQVNRYKHIRFTGFTIGMRCLNPTVTLEQKMTAEDQQPPFDWERQKLTYYLARGDLISNHNDPDWFLKSKLVRGNTSPRWIWNRVHIVSAAKQYTGWLNTDSYFGGGTGVPPLPPDLALSELWLKHQPQEAPDRQYPTNWKVALTGMAAPAVTAATAALLDKYRIVNSMQMEFKYYFHFDLKEPNN